MAIAPLIISIVALLLSMVGLVLNFFHHKILKILLENLQQKR